MKKASRIFLALIIVPFLVPMARSATSFIGKITQTVDNAGTFPVQVNGSGAVATTSTSTIVTNGGTFAVQAAATLATETTKVIGTINVSAGQTIAVTNAGTFLVQTAGQVAVPTIAKVGATTTSAQLIAANSTRKFIEVDCDCANTDGVAINFGAGAAVYASHKQLSPCSTWEAPAGVAVQTAIQIIANSGTQNCRVIEYP